MDLKTKTEVNNLPIATYVKMSYPIREKTTIEVKLQVQIHKAAAPRLTLVENIFLL